MMPCAESIFWGEPECIPFHKANSHLPKFCFPILENKDTSRLASRAHTKTKGQWRWWNQGRRSR